MNVHNIVEQVIKKYKTRSPYELADLMGISIHRCELGTIRGYYSKNSVSNRLYLIVILQKMMSILFSPMN